MIILRKSNLLTESDLPADFGLKATSAFSGITGRDNSNLTFHESQKKLIIDALNKFSWNKTRAAKYLQIPRHVLLYRLKKYGIKKPDQR